MGGRGIKVQNAKIMQNPLPGAQLQRENVGEETHTTTSSRTGRRAENRGGGAGGGLGQGGGGQV